MSGKTVVFSANNRMPGFAPDSFFLCGLGVLASLLRWIGLAVLFLHADSHGAQAQTSQTQPRPEPQSVVNDVATWTRSVNSVNERSTRQMQEELTPLNIQDALAEPVLRNTKAIAERRRRITEQMRIIRLMASRIKENIDQSIKLADNIEDAKVRSNIVRSFVDSSGAALIKTEQIVDLKLEELRLTDDLLESLPERISCE